jgi:hypothetical protein
MCIVSDMITRPEVAPREQGGRPAAAGVRCVALAAEGAIPTVEVGVGSEGRAAAEWPAADVTDLRCGGCGAGVKLAQRERHYGQLVCGFLDQHHSCGGSVEFSGRRTPG